MIPCPKCGNQDYRSSRQCPMMDGQAVCARCCTECVYYDTDPLSIYACRYYIVNPKPDYRGEIYKLNRQIEMKERQIEHFYSTNKPWIAQKVEAELSWIRHQRAEMKRKQDEENQRTGATL